jgi:ParB family transcriptional regulator, chromosome partitioning protein
MSKDKDLLAQIRGHVAESIGAGRGAIPGGAADVASDRPTQNDGRGRLKGAAEIEVARIVRDPGQPREDFESPEALADLASLTESVRARGVLQPIRVRWDEGQGMYVLIAGERRLRAARGAGRPTVPCIIHEGPLSEADIVYDQIAENIFRRDLNGMEQARGFKRLMDARGWSARRLAEELHIDHERVSEAVRLLGLPEDIQEQVEAGAIPPSTAAALTRAPDEATVRELASRAARGELTRDEVKATVRRAQAEGSRDRTKGRGAKSKPRKVTSRTFKAAGYRIAVENRRGVEPVTLATALRDVLGQVEAELQGRGEAAA